MPINLEKYKLPTTGGALDKYKIQPTEDPTRGASSGIFTGPLSTTAVPGQTLAKSILSIGQRGSQQNIADSAKQSSNQANQLFAQSEAETDPVRKRALFDQGMRFANATRDTATGATNLQQSNLEAQRVETPLGTIPALSDEPGRNLQQNLGRGLSTVGFLGGLGPVLGSAAFGAGLAQEEGDGFGSTVAKAGLFAIGGKMLGGLFNKVSGTNIGQRVLQSKAAQTVGNIFEATTAKKSTSGAGVALDTAVATGEKFLDKILSPSTYKPFVTKPSKAVYEAFTTPANELKVNQAIDEGFPRSIKPTTRKNLPQQEALKESQRAVVKDIAENADNLTITGNEGELFNGVPQTRQQFGEAIQQRKAQIWGQVEQANKAAGGLGVQVEMQPVVNELEAFANNKINQTAHPSATKYAQEMAERLKLLQRLSPEEAQMLLAEFNAKAKSFWRSPNPNDLGSALVDAMVANNTRATLDTSMQALGTAESAPFRRLYGHYANIEKDVARASGRAMNASEKSIVDNLFDIKNAGELIAAITTGNAALGTKAVATSFFKRFRLSYYAPDKVLERMFGQVFKGYKAGVIQPTVYPGFDPEKWLAGITKRLNPDGLLSLPAPSSIPLPAPRGKLESAFTQGEKEAFATKQSSIFSEQEKQAFTFGQNKEAQASRDLLEFDKSRGANVSQKKGSNP